MSLEIRLDNQVGRLEIMPDPFLSICHAVRLRHNQVDPLLSGV